MEDGITTQLYPEDVTRAVAKLPERVARLLQAQPVFIAGGYVRDTIAGQRPRDIDVFTPGAECSDACISALGGADKAHVTEFAHTFPGTPPVQVIRRWSFGSPDEIFEHFDFTIARAAIFFADGEWRGVCGSRFYADVAAKRIVFDPTDATRSELDDGGSLLRLCKYLRRGYSASPETISLVTFAAASRAASVTALTEYLRGIDPEYLPPWMRPGTEEQ